ncbi:phosphoribosylformylglycinamidine synthase subunit PurL [Flavipsychrobacter stenotrophus]|uniref:Phosphoribosylformylglycinamidine synthase subunit PurL n=1 Tax=Flavipsychrobacter stenotrophus TaxID=2077091 RepID=A0A2S7SVG0_9BACT|nr:phosphoribosylformylglycinamidine synthase subunit PurL [Flavipsychrobacter stenotrophus]PQJ10922.1 phosphoribosylformylglycinamidine synthase subunit PurL [Flavipsychrobacter stenotrophus]
MIATLEQATKLGLREEEFEKIKEILGRTPNFTETAMYSVMWSEHCSYKNSITWLKTLPRDGDKLLVKAGEENAGLVDIGDGWGCVFKIESHNHPSAIEPFQGAATGVGGIHRDIFTMGARPIASLNSLRFGKVDNPKTKWLIKGVVKGIGHYGNCFGVPTVAGEVYYESCYQTNPLVNAMSVGVVRVGETVSATSYGEGNPVFIVGASTGKDGIGGASFASADISENSAEQLPSVQVGDPFEEKKLLEACLEMIPTGALIGMQDMGAAGITCSTSEMSAKGEHGMIIHLDKVPTRQANMKPWEMLLSESQERMLIVVKKGRESEVQTIFDKWDIHCVQIGEVTKDLNLKYYMNGELIADVPAESLVLGGGAPIYERQFTTPAYLAEINKFDINNVAQPADLKEIAYQLIQLPNIASKRWIYEQYDSMVGTGNTQTNEPSDAAIVRVHGTEKVLAMTTDCNSRYVYANPRKGAMIAVSEAARNIVCSGGLPVAITNCLNFGNPYNPEVYYQFVEAIQGMGEACRKFDTPVTGGNVSFYNQSEDGPVYPTPTIGMVGVLENINQKMSLGFKHPGDTIYMLGTNYNDINCSEYLHHIIGESHSPAPHFELEEEYVLQQTVANLISMKLVKSAHDISEGGLFACMLESAMANGLGFNMTTDANLRKDAMLFGEAQSRVVVSVNTDLCALFEAELKGLPFTKLGIVNAHKEICVDGQSWGYISDWKEAYDTALEKLLA